jgi:hypothetical protein
MRSATPRYVLVAVSTRERRLQLDEAADLLERLPEVRERRDRVSMLRTEVPAEPVHRFSVVALGRGIVPAIRYTSPVFATDPATGSDPSPTALRRAASASSSWRAVAFLARALLVDAHRRRERRQRREQRHDRRCRRDTPAARDELAELVRGTLRMRRDRLVRQIAPDVLRDRGRAPVAPVRLLLEGLGDDGLQVCTPLAVVSPRACSGLM